MHGAVPFPCPCTRARAHKGVIYRRQRSSDPNLARFLLSLLRSFFLLLHPLLLPPTSSPRFLTSILTSESRSRICLNEWHCSREVPPDREIHINASRRGGGGGEGASGGLRRGEGRRRRRGCGSDALLTRKERPEFASARS